MIAEIYCDGGCINRTPSPLAGCWAWVQVDLYGEMVERQSGVVTPAEAGLATISNDHIELLAAVLAIETGPDHGYVLWTDSFTTLERLLVPSPSWVGISADLRQRTLAARKRKPDVRFVAAHPSYEDLERGHNHKGDPVSKWNVLVDRLCKDQANAFRERMTLMGWPGMFRFPREVPG